MSYKEINKEIEVLLSGLRILIEKKRNVNSAKRELSISAIELVEECMCFKNDEDDELITDSFQKTISKFTDFIELENIDAWTLGRINIESKHLRELVVEEKKRRLENEESERK